MAKFRKKPVVIEAIQYLGDGPDNAYDVMKFTGKPNVFEQGFFPPVLLVETLEGVMRAEPRDWIIRGVKGEIYPCKPDIFAATYEPAS